ncbi:MAG: DUF5654 family protein [Ktedonobacterales bacterium]
MSEDIHAAEQRRRLGLPQGMDPRRALDPAALERVMRAQAMARAQASVATTIVIGTIVTLVTSAFSFVAALAWNDAINQIINRKIAPLMPKAGPTTLALLHASAVTIIAVVAVVILNRVAGRWAKRSAIGNTAGDGSY